jgi:hypothetical protein
LSSSLLFSFPSPSRLMSSSCMTSFNPSFSF